MLRILKQETWDASPAEREVARAMSAAFRAYADAVSAAADDPELLRRAEEAFHAAWRGAVERLVVDAGAAEVARLGLSVRFDLRNPHVEGWLAVHGAELVTGVSDTTRSTIREITRTGYLQGVTARTQATLLREVLPLLPQHAAAVDRRVKALVDAGASEVDIISRGGHYARKLLRYRADMVARTETMSAQNAGLQSAWDTARDEGLLLPQTRKVWIATPMGTRTCELCRPWHGLEAKPDEPFTMDGRTLMAPPLHPSCRCTMGLRTR